MTLIAFIITSVNNDPKLLSAKFLLPMISLKRTLYELALYNTKHYLLYDNTIYDIT